MSLAQLKTFADTYADFYIGKSDMGATKEVLEALVDSLTKTRAVIVTLKARVKALEDA